VHPCCSPLRLQWRLDLLGDGAMTFGTFRMRHIPGPSALRRPSQNPSGLAAPVAAILKSRGEALRLEITSALNLLALEWARVANQMSLRCSPTTL
jgi:hypothetical protein